MNGIVTLGPGCRISNHEKARRINSRIDRRYDGDDRPRKIDRRERRVEALLAQDSHCDEPLRRESHPVERAKKAVPNEQAGAFMETSPYLRRSLFKKVNAVAGTGRGVAAGTPPGRSLLQKGPADGRMDAAVGQVSGSDVLKNAEKRSPAAFSPGNFFRSGAGRYDFNSGVRKRHSTEPEISPPQRTLAFDAMHYSHRSFRLRGPSQYIMNEITEDLIERFVAFPESLGETIRERVAAALQADRAAREIADFYRAYYKEYRREGSESRSDEAGHRRSDPPSDTLNGRSPAR